MENLSKRDIVLPQIIFLDLNMPRKGGIECLREIRSDELLKDIIVAIYSTSSSERDLEESFKEGANIYIRKPNDFNSLRNMMVELLKLDWKNHLPFSDKERFLLQS